MAYFLDILRALNDASVEYVIVGGVATVLHGHLRVTADVDLVIRLDRENVLLMLEVVRAAGLLPRLPVDPTKFADPVVRREWVEQRGMMVFSFFDPTNATTGVDIFADDKQDYTGLRERSELKQLGGVPVRVCSLDDLLRMKTAADRPIDRQDVAALTRIRDHG